MVSSSLKYQANVLEAFINAKDNKTATPITAGTPQADEKTLR